LVDHKKSSLPWTLPNSTTDTCIIIKAVILSVKTGPRGETPFKLLTFF
jgi:hypothetical protein